ncbi:hypothetical protein LMG10661_03853 [Ralstonia syzygii subsp. syzygii]|nr:hypothetical protein LMG10661_03853 [Ralstonia syzygii subsp. syzygii]
MQSADGSVRIALWPDKIKMTSPTIELDAQNVNCTGNLTTEGRVTGKGGVTFGETPAESHRHTNVQNGPDTSGGPV